MWKLSRARLRSFPRGAGLPQSLSSQLGLHPHTTPAPAGLVATGAHLSLPLPVAHLELRPKEGLQSSYGKGASRAPSPPPQHCEASGFSNSRTHHSALLLLPWAPLRLPGPSPLRRLGLRLQVQSGLAPTLAAGGSRAPGFTF